MAQTKLLNQYIGTDPQGNGTTIVAASMEAACKVYRSTQEVDPVQMQRVKQNVMCALPDLAVTFTAEVYCAAATPTGCSVTPGTFTVLSGTEQVFTATAGEGFAFSKWLIDGVEVTDSSGAVVTDPVALLTIPSGSKTCEIKAVFVVSA